jgi:hypothetical protein
MGFIGRVERKTMNANFFELKGLRIERIEGASAGSDEVLIVTTALASPTFRLVHYQDCCEGAAVESVSGNPEDHIGKVVTLAEEDSVVADVGESSTRTTFRIQTEAGEFVIVWLGESNGYYNVSVEVERF